jgi:hypothetical protein
LSDFLSNTLEKGSTMNKTIMTASFAISELPEIQINYSASGCMTCTPRIVSIQIISQQHGSSDEPTCPARCSPESTRPGGRVSLSW